MSHLTLETIARLVDESPTAVEAAHLDACAVCRAEVDAMREDVQALSMLPDMTPAPDAWAALEDRLAAEGLVRRRGFAIPLPRFAWAAAAAALFLAGGLTGRLTSGPVQQIVQTPTGPGPAAGPAADTAERVPAVAPQLAGDLPVDSDGIQAGADAAPDRGRADAPVYAEPQARPAPGVTLAGNTFGGAQQPRTLEEAALFLRQTEELYLNALTRYAELATQAEAGDPVSRLAALQSIVMTTQAALSQAPADPVINGYHLTALAQRDATLRQVAAASGDRWY
ncbi:MAG TPA: hypothetical protein VK936_04960 [Longimicrobiales bacterium]|nr:hypothetical protein [Longimicrobiales bacterium]